MDYVVENEKNAFDDIEDFFMEASYAMEINSDTEVGQIEEQIKSLDNTVDNKIPSVIDKLKKLNKKDEIKSKIDFKALLKSLDKDTKDFVSGVNKYNKSTIYSKANLGISLAVAFTNPITAVIPGSSIPVYTVMELNDYLLELGRRWKGSNRSAVNDFVAKCKKRENQLNSTDILNTKEKMKATKAIVASLKNLEKILVNALTDVSRNIQAHMIDFTDKTVWKGTEAAGKAIDNATKNSKSETGKKINAFGKKLNSVSSDLRADAKTAISASENVKEAKKMQKAILKAAKATKKAEARKLKYANESAMDLIIEIYESEISGNISARDRARLINEIESIDGVLC